MARAITKTFGGSDTIVTVMRFVDGAPVQEMVTISGKASERKIQTELFKRFNTRNFMVVNTEQIENANDSTYTMDAETFFAYSDVCKEGESYGHDTVTATFKNTTAQYYVLGDMEPKTFYYLGTTTANKLRNAIIEECGDANILVGNVYTKDVRCFMSKEKFIELARKVEK